MMLLLVCAPDSFIIVLFLLSKKFLLPVVVLPLSNKFIDRWECVLMKRRRRTRSSLRSMPVKRLSGSYFVVTEPDSAMLRQSSMSRKRPSPSNVATR